MLELDCGKTRANASEALNCAFVPRKSAAKMLPWMSTDAASMAEPKRPVGKEMVVARRFGIVVELGVDEVYIEDAIGVVEAVVVNATVAPKSVGLLRYLIFRSFRYVCMIALAFWR